MFHQELIEEKTNVSESSTSERFEKTSTMRRFAKQIFDVK